LNAKKAIIVSLQQQSGGLCVHFFDAERVETRVDAAARVGVASATTCERFALPRTLSPFLADELAGFARLPRDDGLGVTGAA
jgi:hypothetical protein